MGRCCCKVLFGGINHKTPYGGGLQDRKGFGANNSVDTLEFWNRHHLCNAEVKKMRVHTRLNHCHIATNVFTFDESIMVLRACGGSLKQNRKWISVVWCVDRLLSPVALQTQSKALGRHA
ncbi:hypothetical protein Vafri_17861 [Volvox africanus]|uniref:Uncharacterized protein n=1 Tax=Volvox africanus TaxID=51714 RepID=A0A8J4BLL4_9CHLO|nr:hypothetical protein Vafri_17861 [Volvox africanus]